MRRSRLVPIALLLVLTVVASAAVSGANVAQHSQLDATEHCEFPVDLTDATGETITLDEEPESIVALYPSDAQIAFEIGVEDRVVGMPVGPYTDSLDAGDRTDITEDDGLTPVTERIIDLEPDVVLAASIADQDLIDALREDGDLTVYVFEQAGSIEDVQTQVQTAGELTGECEGAEETITWMDDTLEDVEDLVGDEEPPLAYYAMGDGFTAGEGTFQHEVLETAGLDNVGERAGIEGWDVVSEETLIEEDPEWIVYGEMMDEPPIEESVWQTTAGQEENFLAVDDNALNQPGPQIVAVIEAMAETVHGDAAEEEADADDEVDDAADEDADDASEAEDDGEATETEDADEGVDTADSIPGFGVGVAVVALLAVLGLVGRNL